MQEFFFYFDENDKTKGVLIPKGFITDFATVPWYLWSIYPPTGLHTKPAVLHDFLYSKESPLTLSRKECDKMFLDSMKALKVKKRIRYPMYWGVRFKGYKKYKTDDDNINVNLMI